MHPRDVSHDVLQHLANVPGADEDRLGVLEARATPCSEVLVAAHRVLELGAVSLDREWKSGGDRDGPPEQDVIREHEIGRRVSAQSGRVQGDVTIALRAGAILQQLGLEAFVAVEDEDGQHTPDIRSEGARPPHVVPLRVRLLTDHHDVVTRVAPFACQRPRVHVGAGATEQIAVPEEDSH